MPRKGWKHSQESRAKMSMAGINRRHSQETREKMSRAALGREHSVEARAKMSISHRGENAYNWKNGRVHNGDYLYRLCPNHPFSGKNGYIGEHRIIMEAHLGRVLLPTEIVHHINGNKIDNRIENLMLFSSNSEHMKNHGKK